MADGYISEIKLPDNKVYLLKDSEKTDEKVAQVGNAEDKDFPIILKNTNNTTDETANVKYSNNTTTDATTTKPFTFNPSTGTLKVTQIKIGTKDDSKGLFPVLNNWNQIGASNLYWYRSYINNYYGSRSHVDNWDSGKNIGTAATTSAAATKGTVNFYNSAAANTTQTKTLLEANANTNSNITITLPSSTGTLALTSQIPTNLNQLTNGPGYVTSSGVTKVSTGAGLTGGDITTTGTVKANLTSETKLTNAAADGTETSERVYPVRLDKNGKLAVNVPWTNVNSSYLTAHNNLVTQTITTTSADYRVLFSGTADDTSRAEQTRKDADFKYNPSTNQLIVGNNILSADYIEGNGGRIQKVSIAPQTTWANITADTWYRCCKIAAKYNYATFIIQFGGNWSTGAPTMATVSVQVRNTNANITLLHCAYTGNIKAIRLVNHSGWWLDVQLNMQPSGTKGSDTATFIGNVVVSDISASLTATTDTTAPAATLHFKTKYNDDTTFKINNSINILDTTASTTVDSGALLVDGGAGIGGRVTAQEFNATRQMVLSAGKIYSNISGSNVLLPAKTTAIYANGIAIANPGLTAANDVGWIRALGTAETDMVLEIATGDDGGAGEQIVARQYNTSNAIAHEAILLSKTGATSFPVSVTAPSFSGSGASLTSLNASNLTSGTVPAARLPLATTSAAGAVKVGSGISVSDGTISVTAENLGLSNALHFIGITSTDLTDGSTTATLTAKSTNSLSKTTGFVDGDVVMDGDQLREYVWSGSAWRLLGITTSTVYKQPASTATNTWIAQVSQGTDGKITATTGSLNTSGTWSGNATTATTATNLANNPSIQTSGTTQVTITAGGKTSSAYTVPYATSAGSATTATYIKCTDTRNATLNPTDLNAAQGVRFDFKAKGTINLTATDSYAGVMSFRPYSHNTDWSGGNAHQIAFNSEGLHWRNGGASWGDWIDLLNANNYSSYALPLSGGTMTGHIFMGGSNASSSTANTTQLVFGTSTTQHIAVTSNDKAFILNPSTSSTTNQIVLYLNKKSKFPSGIEGDVTGDLTGNADTATTATNLSAAPSITSGGTATVTLSANTAYTLTVGGKSVIFKTPADANTNTATAKDNILDGSNSGTEITYAPYTAQQSKLSFDTSTTAPTRTDRLNLNGFLYATKYNVAGHVTLQYNSTDSSLEFVFA